MAALPRHNKRDFTSVFMNIKAFIGSAQNAHILTCMLRCDGRPLTQGISGCNLFEALEGKELLPAHGGKRRLMAPGGRLMTENDRSWGISDGF